MAKDFGEASLMVIEPEFLRYVGCPYVDYDIAVIQLRRISGPSQVYDQGDGEWMSRIEVGWH